MTKDERAQVRELGFKVESSIGRPKKGGSMEHVDIIRCTKCSDGWTYPAGKDASPAMRLKLLDHAVSHR